MAPHNYALLLLVLFSLAMSTVSCVEEEELVTCEYENRINGEPIYYCREDEEISSCEFELSFVDSVVHDEWLPCSRLGYSHQDSDGDWIVEQGTNVRPGACGAWGDGSASCSPATSSGNDNGGDRGGACAFEVAEGIKCEVVQYAVDCPNGQYFEGAFCNQIDCDTDAGRCWRL